MYSSDTYKAIVGVLKTKYKKKSHFFVDMERELGTSIPARTTYVKAIERLFAQGHEREFSQFIWGANSIQEWQDLTDKILPLGGYAKDEIVQLCPVFEELDNSWKPEGKTKLAILFSILRHFDESQISEAVKRAVERSLISALVVSDRYVMGPLGIMESHDGLGWDAQHLVERMLDFIGERNRTNLVGALPKRKILLKLNPQDVRFGPKLKQILIAEYSKSELLEAVLSLIAEGRVDVEDEISIDYYRTLTRFGIIESGDNPVEDLVETLAAHCDKNTLRSLLKKYEVVNTDIVAGLTELCLRETPSLFRPLFSIDQLKSIARSYNFVALDSLTVGDEDLIWDLLLTRMGFLVPPRLEGRRFILKQLLTINTELRSLKVFPSDESISRLVGLMMQFYSTCERVLKDIVHFHSALVWDWFEGTDLDSLHDALINGLELDETIGLKLVQNRLTFGEWVGVLRSLVKKTKRGTPEQQKLIEYTGRRRLLGGCSMKILNEISEIRGKYRHDTGKSIPTLGRSLTMVEKTLSFMQCIIDNDVYPVLCRVIRKMTNEYGMTHSIIEQESGRKRVIAGSRGLRMGSAFLISARKGVIAESSLVVYPVW